MPRSNLGAAYNVGGAHNLVFSYGALLTSTPNPTGDYNNDGIVDAADYVLWRSMVGTELPNDSTPGTRAARRTTPSGGQTSAKRADPAGRVR